VTRVEVSGGEATLVKEYAGGVRGEFGVPLPAVLGVQAAERPPRYVPVARVRAAMRSQKIEVVPSAGGVEAAPVEVLHLAKPEATGHAEMLEGTPEEVASKVCEVLAERGLL